MSQIPDWKLDARLDADTTMVADLPLCRLLVMRDANYPWLILVPRVADAVEVIDLMESARAILMGEIASASKTLRAVTRCQKLNVAALGNMVPQLHVHVIARFHDDPAWPSPVWGKAAAKPYETAVLERFVAELRRQLPMTRTPATKQSA